MPNQPKPAPGTRGHYISKIPDDLWREMRDKAQREDTSVSSVTIELWTEWLRALRRS